MLGSPIGHVRIQTLPPPPAPPPTIIRCAACPAAARLPYNRGCTLPRLRRDIERAVSRLSAAATPARRDETAGFRLAHHRADPNGTEARRQLPVRAPRACACEPRARWRAPTAYMTVSSRRRAADGALTEHDRSVCELAAAAAQVRGRGGGAGGVPHVPGPRRRGRQEAEAHGRTT